MKVLFLSNLYPPNVVGGYERLCHDVASAFVGFGHQVSVLTSTYGGGRQNYPGQTVHRTLRLLANDTNIYAPFPGTDADRATINQGNVEALHRVIAEERPDVVFAWNLFFFDRSLLDALGRTGVRVVFMLTDNWLIAALDGAFMGRFFRDYVFGDRDFPETVRPAGLRGLLARWRRPTPARFPMPHEAVFGANFMRTLYTEAGVTFDRSVVIHNGVRLTEHSPEHYADRSRLADAQEARLLFAGRLVDLKGVHTAIEALTLLPRDGLPTPKVRLTIIGDGQDTAYAERLQELIERTGTRDRITFLPPVSEDALFDEFQQHDVYLFPSLYEPFSLTLIHALAAGIPTVASRVGGNGEIVAHGGTGLLFRKGDAADLATNIATLLRDPTLRSRVSAEARRVARSFTFERMARGMEDHLLRLPAMDGAA